MVDMVLDLSILLVFIRDEKDEEIEIEAHFTSMISQNLKLQVLPDVICVFGW